MTGWNEVELPQSQPKKVVEDGSIVLEPGAYLISGKVEIVEGKGTVENTADGWSNIRAETRVKIIGKSAVRR